MDKATLAGSHLPSRVDQTLNIDDIDWTPFYYQLGGTDVEIMSEDERTYCREHHIQCWIWENKGVKSYFALINKYYERFGTLMPIPLRKHLLKELQNGN